jgi:hypothetical protein
MPTLDYTNIKMADPAILGLAPVVYYTVPAGNHAISTSITVANFSTGSVRLSVHFVPSGGSPDNSNVLVPDVSMTEKTVANFNFGQILNPNDTIQAYAEFLNSITIHLSGILTTP